MKHLNMQAAAVKGGALAQVAVVNSEVRLRLGACCLSAGSVLLLALFATLLPSCRYEVVAMFHLEILMWIKNMLLLLLLLESLQESF